ncbi:MAG: hypothetical protein GY713_11390 [Actinomycetia bacterium]|nr:hypothetical protein [Actinomycetes bacterium]MCP3911547.1 hypothetical protein [Actinomycetes bacterium]
MSDPGALRVEFVGEEILVPPHAELTFGRSADLVIDDNPYLHRVLGRFSVVRDMWWLTNTGRSSALAVTDAAGSSYSRIAPGSGMAITFPEVSVRFEAGAARYEIEVFIPALEVETRPEPEPRPDDSAGPTVTVSRVPLTPEQLELLVALAEPRLLEPGSQAALPTNKAVAARLTWSRSKFNRKLDALCAKLARAGVAGLHGSAGELARDRRLRLVEHAITTGVVNPEDLRVIDRGVVPIDGS